MWWESTKQIFGFNLHFCLSSIHKIEEYGFWIFIFQICNFNYNCSIRIIYLLIVQCIWEAGVHNWHLAFHPFTSVHSHQHFLIPRCFDWVACWGRCHLSLLGGESLGCVNLLRLICRYLGFPTTRHACYHIRDSPCTASCLPHQFSTIATVTGGYNASFSYRY